MIFNSFQSLKHGKLGEMKKVDLIGGNGGILKMASRAGAAVLSIVLSMKKIYPQSDDKEYQQKRYIEDS